MNFNLCARTNSSIHKQLRIISILEKYQTDFPIYLHNIVSRKRLQALIKKVLGYSWRNLFYYESFIWIYIYSIL